MLRKYAIAVAAAILFTGSVQAQPITFNFEGTLTQGSIGGTNPWSIGDTFSGSYTFDAGAVNEHESVGRYALLAYSVTVGTSTFAGGLVDSRIHVADNFSGSNDQYGIVGGSAFTGNLVLPLIQWEFHLVDFQGLMLSGNGLLLTPPSLSSVEHNEFQIFCGDDVFAFTASGPLTSFTSVSPIPEPETYAMLLAGLALLGFVTKRRVRLRAAA
jgi:hypothetical protein